MAAVCVLGLPAGLAFAQSRPAGATAVRVTTIDGAPIQGAWMGADADGVDVAADGRRRRIPRDDLMLISFGESGPTTRSAAPGTREVLCTLAGGGTIRGELVAGEQGGIRLRNPLAGEIPLRFSDLTAVRLGSAGQNSRAQAELDRWLAKPPSGNDVLIAIRDGGVATVRGAVAALGPDGGKFTFGGRTLPMRPDITYAVVFGAGLSPTESPWTVTLRDGSTIAASPAKSDATSLAVLLGDRTPIAVPVEHVEAIAVRSPRVAFASDMEPAAAVFEPFLETPWPHRRDRSVSNRPLRLGGVEYAKGLGVHSRSDITFATDGKYAQFAAVIGIDDCARPRGNVVFRVLADDREAFTSGPVTGRDEPRPIVVDIRGAKRVRLIVEYGEELDLGDHADWAHARFIR